ncbi:MAG TPA: hypothetical protein G4N92_04435 [Anaerolineae bacterium]|nr:hypothetical protein [Anaerolineae bacterium]
MPNFIDHIHQAEHNKKVSEYLLTDNQYYDWALVTIFYSSLHLIEALIINTFHKNTNQLRRSDQTAYNFMEEFIKINYSDKIWKLYHSFQQASMVVRYLHHYKALSPIPSHSYYKKTHVEHFIEKKFPSFTQLLTSESNLNLII